jgi:hypothetical protein
LTHDSCHLIGFGDLRSGDADAKEVWSCAEKPVGPHLLTVALAAEVSIESLRS